MATYTVQRSKWYRGKGSETSKLLRSDGMRCCIGFVGQQCGLSDDDLLNVSDIRMSVDNNPILSKSWPEWMVEINDSLDDAIGTTICKAYRINDRKLLPDTDRERQLAGLFAEHGDTLLFVD